MEVISKEILEFCNKENWEERESFWISEKNTKWPNGYNLTDGGEGGKGKIVTDESRALMSKRREENGTFKGENNPMFGNAHSKEAREKISRKRIEKGIAKGRNNGRFDNILYKFKSIKTGEIFEGYKFDLAKILGSNSSALNAVIMASFISLKA